MARIESREDLAIWLESQSREAAIVIAARLTLRVLPLIGFGYNRVDDKLRYRQTFLLPVFRAMAASWVAQKYPLAGRVAGWASADAGSNASFAAASTSTFAIAASFGAITLGDTAAFAAASASSAAAASFGSPSDTAYHATRDASLKATLFAAKSFAAAAESGSKFAEAKFWAEIAADCEAIDAGFPPDQLVSERLWDDGVWPSNLPWLESAWRELRKNLLRVPGTTENWQVWIDWYEDRLHGRPSDGPTEIFRVTLSEEAAGDVNGFARTENWRAILNERRQIWDSGPAKVNSLIAAFLARRQKELTAIPKTAASAIDALPPLRSAALEPIFKDGRLIQPRIAAGHAHSDDDLLEAIEASRQYALALAEDVLKEPSLQYDRRAGIYLQDLAARLPTRMPTVTELHLLGIELEALKRLSASVQREWPEVLAARFEALRLQFDRTISQFPKWRAFLAVAEPPVTEGQAEAIVMAVPAIVDVLETPENALHVDAVIPETLRWLVERLRVRLAELEELRQRAAETIEFGAELLAADLLESLSNVAKVLAEAVLKTPALWAVNAGRSIAETVAGATAAFAKGADDALKSRAENLGREMVNDTGDFLRRSWKAFLYGASGLPVLATLFPSVFGWLRSDVIDLLAKLLGLH